jgi:hypothetical protein
MDDLPRHGPRSLKTDNWTGIVALFAFPKPCA